MRKMSIFATAAFGVAASALPMMGQQGRQSDPQQRPTPDQPRQGQPQQVQPEPGRPGEARPGMDDRDRVSEPGAEHRILDACVGSWQVTGQCWESPDMGKGDAGKTDARRADTSRTDQTRPDASRGQAGAESVTGTVNCEWVLGNRFIKSHVRGTSGSESMEGIGMCGYDRTKNKYVSTWQDTKCTSIKMDEGNYEPSSRTFTYTGEYTGPDGQKISCRRTVRLVSNDEHVMTAYMTVSGQPEKKISELTFRRAGTARTDAR